MGRSPFQLHHEPIPKRINLLISSLTNKKNKSHGTEKIYRIQFEKIFR